MWGIDQDSASARRSRDGSAPTRGAAASARQRSTRRGFRGAVAWLTLALGVAASPAFAEGSRNLYPSTYPAGGFRSAMDLRATAGQRYMGAISGRQFLYVYAEAGEYILVGSRNRAAANGGNVLVYNPGPFGTKADETRPAAADFACNSSTPPAGSYSGGALGLIADRTQELAGPNSADNTVTVTGGFAPCAYRAPTTGLYGVQFTGATSGGSGTPNGSVATPQILTDQVSAWDVTVRANATSTTDLNGRLFSYAWVGYTGANPRPVYYTLYYVTGDGYRYRQTLRGVDPNAAAFYANNSGFLDAGAPLYKDVRGNSNTVGTGTFPPGVTPQQPSLPLFFNDVDGGGSNSAEVAKTLGALGIPLTPPTPQLTNPVFVGNVGGNQSTVSTGGVFQFDTVNTLTYEIVISLDGVDFDPANTNNRVLTGTALTGSHNVLWDGMKNDGTPFPVGDYKFRISGRNGEIHFPMLDLEGNANGGPTMTKLNGSGGATVYFDDRGYRTSGGTLVGALNGHLCGAGNAQVQPVPNHSLVGVDSSVADGSGRYYRWWTASGNSGPDCLSNANEAFGNLKGLDLWALERSPVIEEPIEIVHGSVLTDVGVQLVVTSSVYPGETVYGNLVYSHAGDIGSADATNVAYTAVIGTPGNCPSGVSFPLLPAGVTFAYNAATCAVTFAGMPATLTPGTSLAFRFQYTAPAAGPVPVSATIDSAEDPLAGSPRPPNQPVPNRAEASTNVIVADVTTTIMVPPTAAPGATVPGTVTFENLGAATATAEGVTYTLVIGTPGSCPAGVAFPTLPAGVTANYNPATCAVSFTGMPTLLDPGQGVTIGFTYTAPASGTIPVHSGIATVTPESNTANNTDDDQTVVLPTADVSIVKTGPANVAAGAPISYTLTIANAGPSAADGASFSDAVPAAITGVAAVCGAVTGGAVCNNADIAVAGNLVSGTIATLPNGGSAQILVTGTAPTAGGTLHNAAHVDPPTGTDDPNPDDNDGDVDTGVDPLADMAAAIDLPPTANAGDPVHGTFSCTNNGPSAAENATCTVAGLPGGAVVVCTPPVPVASLPPGGVISCTVDFTAPATGPVTGTATAGSDTPDPNPANNVAVDTLQIVPVAHLAIVKTGPASVVAGNDVTYTITVSNSGPSDAAGVMLDDPAPGAGITFVSATAPCTGGFPCALGTLAANASVPVTVTFHVAANYSGPSPFTNTASAWSPTDPDHGSAGTPVRGTAQTQVGAAPDLAIAKHHDGDFHQGQVGATYSIVVSNVGAGPTTGTTTVTETLPAGLTATAISGTGWTCTLSPLGCSRSDVLAAGASWPSIVLTVDVADNATNLVNHVSVSTPNDPNPGNDEDDDTTTITPSADIAVVKTVDDDTPNVGETITFTVVATNNGPSPATNVVISDGLPAGLLFVSATPSQGSYDQASGNWTIPGPLAVGDSATLTMQAQVTAPGSIVNTAIRTGGDQFDPVSSNNSGSAPINSAPSADLQVRKTVDNATPNVGSNVTFRITVHNAGPNDATGVVIGDVLPAGLTYVSSTASIGSYNTGTGQWTIGNLDNGDSATLDIVATVTTTDPIVNTARVVGSDQFDPDPSNNEGGVPVNGQAADIQVVKTADNANVTLGDTVTYTVTVTNNGPSAATNVSVTDQLPAGLDFISATASQGTYDAATGLWTIGDLDASGAGATVTLTIQATVTTLDEIINVATSNGGDQPDPIDGNNSDEVPIHGSQLPAPTAQKSFDPATAPVGATVHMTITLSNPNATALTGVGFTDTYPAGLVNAAAPVVVSNTCGGSVTADAGADSLTLAGGTLPANGSCAITVNVIGTTAGTLVNTTGPITSDNGLPGQPATGTLVVTPLSADVSMVKTGPATVDAGGAITYTLTIANAGPDAADGARFSDDVPAGITGVTASCGPVAGGAVCNNGDITVAGNLVSGTIATLPNGGSAQVIITGTAPAAGGTLHNTAHVDPPTGTDDPDPDDNDGDVDTDVGGPGADLGVTKTGSASVLPGGQVAYTIVVHNAGPSAAENARLADPTPAGLVFVSATAPCAGGFPCTLGTLAAGASVSVDVVYDVPADYAGANPIVNTATASSDTPDPDPSNDSDSADTPVGSNPTADLGVTKTGSASVLPGGQVAYTIVVRNAGPSAAENARLADPTPAGLVFVSATAPCAGGFPCTLGTLAAGASVSVDVVYDVSASYAGANPIVNTATASSDTPDPDPSNNSDDADTAVGTTVLPADLSLRKTANATTVRTGDLASWTIVVRNAGPGTATGVHVTDVLPAGLADPATSGCAEDPAGVPTCSLGTLAPGAQVSYTISARVTASSGSLANHASVVGNEPDPTPDDNEDSSTVVVGEPGGQPQPVPATDPRVLALLAALFGLVAAAALRRRRGT